MTSSLRWTIAKSLCNWIIPAEQRALDGKGEDSSGATFKPAGPDAGIPEPVEPAIATFTPHRIGKSGVTIAEYGDHQR